ncbi:MAG: lactate racemase domain-containing protein [Bacteroidales bacterium]|nr:lactate racemase domain-containing protein [Bacteroidales bacterium]MDT8432480.1 lactate racemase domain-containing protein [Bacteroidales bacterium]
MIYFEKGGKDLELSRDDIREGLNLALDRLGRRKKVLAIPPDITRAHSLAGPITEMAWEYYGDSMTDILPALGTHAPMTPAEIKKMYGATPASLFRIHNWRTDVVTLGEVPGNFVQEVSEGRVSYAWPAQVNRLLVEGGHDLLLSIGQVVPHEVIGMANHNKNIFVGTGGPEGINKSHFLGAAYGMERIMGRAKSPVRDVLNYAARAFGAGLPVVYVLTVVGRNSAGLLVPRGLFIGDDNDCFEKAAALSLEVNFEMVPEPLDKVVVYLDPEEFKSTWLGNKSIYRTRMAIADNGQLVVLAPGLKEFGEDPEIDRLIRKYGYRTTPEILDFVANNDDLRNNLSAAAHLIHGSTEQRFSVTYCPENLTREEIESVNYRYADLQMMLRKYDPGKLKDGFNDLPGGERIYFISNPATGLWSTKDKFEN